MSGIALSLFASRIEGVCDEMGAVLKRVAFSPNIKDRLDYSCAIFDAEGELCAQAAHIPVHLGSMAYAMADIVKAVNWSDGDMLMLNDPYLGGTHLPDVTVIAPVYVEKRLQGFVVNRAHHADIGADSPGSMPISSSLSEEGQIIAPIKIVIDQKIQMKILQSYTSAMHKPDDSLADFKAQISANRRGLTRLSALIKNLSVNNYQANLLALNDYAEKLAKQALKIIPQGHYEFEDYMDDDGLGQNDIRIKLCLKVAKDKILLDFTGTDNQVKGNINCPLSVAAAAVYYVFRCLMPSHIPACAGAFRPIRLSAPKKSLINACRPAAVAAGNVETSSRIVDVVMGALVKALPDSIPAASQGSMNNLAMGFAGDEQHAAWDYYETIGGGMGASRKANGLSAVQTHMTNTLNTPVEVLEMAYPLRVTRYEIRQASGGKGRNTGGDGIVREYEFLAPTQATLLTERRCHQPWGLLGGKPGARGENKLDDKTLPAKVSLHVQAGQVLTIKTPGGGGYGESKK